MAKASLPNFHFPLKQVTDHTGSTIGCLTAVQYLGHSEWLCRCRCGRHKVIAARDLVRREHTCSHRGLRMAYGSSANHPLRNIYRSASARCNSTSHPDYPRYGGRGIEFRFQSVSEFADALGERPSLKHSVDRINNDGHYEPGNVRWATQAQQNRNQGRTVLITIGPVTQCARDWAHATGRHEATISNRRTRGWCDVCAVLQPLFGRCPHMKNDLG